MREIVSAAVAPRQFQMMLTTLFGAIELLLGAVGVFGVVSFALAARTREMGARIALGATRADVMRLLFARGLRPVGLGLAVGLAGSVAAARALRGLLFGVTPQDPVALGAVTLVLLSTAALACSLPARRAAVLDPVLTLRHE